MRELRFADFITLQRGFDLPRAKRTPGPIPVIGAAQIQGSHTEAKVPAPVVTTGRSGTLGEVLFVNVPAWPLNTCLWVKDFKGNDPRYVYYFLKTLGLAQYNAGVGVPTLNRNHLDELPLRVHHPSAQRRIAAILSPYDDLIENNTRRIAILEEMARRLYEEWFVRFRFPGHEGVKMVESEIGPVPEGWNVGRLEDVLILQRGFDLPKKHRELGPYPVFASTGKHGNHSEPKVRAPGVVTGRSGSLGTVVYVATDFWPLNTTLWVREFRVGSPLFAFFLLQSLDLAGYNSGAAVPTLNRNDIHGLPLAIPPESILGEFDNLVQPVFDLKDRLVRMNTNLRAQRDLLLPKLISGEIDVSEVGEPVMEAAAE